MEKQNYGKSLRRPENAIKQVKLYEEVMCRIKELIAEGEFKKGNKLPSAESLASHFGVSRIVVREALRLLESMGIVDIVPGKGTFVSSELNEGYLNGFSAILQGSRDLIWNLVEFRQIIEPGIAAIAAAKRSANDIGDLELYFREMKGEIERGKLGINPSLKFHLTLAKATKNPLLVRILLLLGVLLRESREISLSVPERPKEALQEHLRILEAVKAGDSESAEKFMKEHMENLGRALSKVMKKD